MGQPILGWEAEGTAEIQSAGEKLLHVYQAAQAAVKESGERATLDANEIVRLIEGGAA